MKKLIFLLITISSVSFAQIVPENFAFGGGKMLKLNDATPMSNSIVDILIIQDTIWLGTTRGLSKSTDGGTTWKNYYQSKEFGKESITAMAYRDGVIWVATGHTENINGSDQPVGSGLLYSKDNGKSWKSIPQPKDSLADSVVIYGINRLRALPITIDISNITYDIALTDNAVWIASFAGGLRKSTDFGKTWQRVVLPPDYLDEIKPTDTLSFILEPVSGAFGNENNLNHRVFSIATDGKNLLFVGTAGGINKSTDGGISWVKFNHQNQQKGISGNFIPAIGWDANDNSIWAATWKAEGGGEFNAVSRSTNGGKSWNIFLAGENAHNFSFAEMYGTENVFCPTDNGMFRTEDQGSSWLLPGIIKDNSTNSILNTKIFYAAAVHPNNDGTFDVWLGSDNGLVRLRENGLMWQGDWKIFLASQSSDGGETYAFPNPFEPGIDLLKIKYNLIQPTQKVTLQIFDFGMNLVNTILQNATRSGLGEQIEYWDGKDYKGQTVPNGVYFYRISFDSGEQLFGKIIVMQ